MRKIVLGLIFIGLTLYLNANDSVQELFKQLDKAIQQRDQFQQVKSQRIEVLHSMLIHGSDTLSNQYKYSIYEKLYTEYKSFVFDSAFHYATLMLETAYTLPNRQFVQQSKLNVGFTLLSGGMFKETLDTLLSMAPEKLDRKFSLEYYVLLARTWFDLADYVQDDFFRPEYNKRGFKALEMAMFFCDKNSKDFNSTTGLYYLRTENHKMALTYFEKNINDKILTDQEYAVAASSLGFIYMKLDKLDLALEVNTKAAIKDIETSTRETVAILNLAEMLYEQGDIQRSYNYINQAVKDAYFYGARQRKVQVSDILPIIEGKQLSIIERQRKALLKYAIGLTLLALILVVLIYIAFIQYKKLKKIKLSLDQTIKDLREINAKLREVNTIKEEYIGHFFDVISEYIKKIERFKKSIGRKLSMKQFNDIDDIVQNIDLITEREQLYHSFDSIFLKIFPGFMDVFNSLFKENDQITLEEGKGLTPELRIFALIRLGITDNEKIAKFLDYSLTTIYTYKTKVKKKAIVPNDQFEELLMESKIV